MLEDNAGGNSYNFLNWHGLLANHGDGEGHGCIFHWCWIAIELGTLPALAMCARDAHSNSTKTPRRRMARELQGSITDPGACTPSLYVN